MDTSIGKMLLVSLGIAGSVLGQYDPNLVSDGTMLSENLHRLTLGYRLERGVRSRKVS